MLSTKLLSTGKHVVYIIEGNRAKTRWFNNLYRLNV